MEDNGNFEKGRDDGFTQANTYQNTQQNLAQMQSQSTESASGFAIAGMVCGILSIVCCCAWYISGILGILGLVFSIMVLVKKIPGRGLAIAGVICASIGIILAIGLLVFALSVDRGISSMSPSEWRSLLDSIESME
ncbi:MAG: DUF4190 domain-containing protein [Lachnospiraceae bacterium]|nr:DUF4190 domain-containing protein [Lachnospiraceae bacterium]